MKNSYAYGLAIAAFLGGLAVNKEFTRVVGDIHETNTHILKDQLNDVNARNAGLEIKLNSSALVIDELTNANRTLEREVQTAHYTANNATDEAFDAHSDLVHATTLCAEQKGRLQDKINNLETDFARVSLQLDICEQAHDVQSRTPAKKSIWDWDLNPFN